MAGGSRGVLYHHELLIGKLRQAGRRVSARHMTTCICAGLAGRISSNGLGMNVRWLCGDEPAGAFARALAPVRTMFGSLPSSRVQVLRRYVAAVAV